MKHIVQPLAFTLAGIVISLYATIATREDVFLISSQTDFLVSGVIWLSVAVLLVSWMTVVKYCPKIATKWPIKCLDVKNYGKEVGQILSILIPVTVASFVAYVNVKYPEDSQLTDVYQIIFWILVVPTFLLLCKTLKMSRRSRLNQQTADGRDESSADQDNSGRVNPRSINIKIKIVQRFKIQVH